MKDRKLLKTGLNKNENFILNCRRNFNLEVRPDEQWILNKTSVKLFSFSIKFNNMDIKIFRLVFILLALGMVYGCASTSKATSDESEKAKSFEAPSDRGTVYLYRTGRAVNAASQLSVKVNGIDAGGTGPGTFFKWDLKPGTYTFNSATGEASAVIQLEVKAGEVYYIRQDARIGLNAGRVTMKEVSDSKGRKEVQGCKLLVSSYIPE
jgi:hypothetical protein